jgi:hypothetical protein
MSFERASRMQANKRSTRGAKGAKKRPGAPTADLSSDSITLPAASYLEGKRGRVSAFRSLFRAQGPAGREGRWIKTVPGKNCRRWAKVSRIKADASDRYNGRDDL